MKLILDTNAIVRRRWRFDGPHFAILKRAIALGSAELVVPRIVVEEAKNKRREELLKQHRLAMDHIALLNSFLPNERHVAEPSIDLVAAVAEADKTLDLDLAQLIASRPDYSDIAHVDVVGRDLNRRRPFQDSGKGYRDALLWETIVRKVANENDKAFLITHNIKDFCADQEPRALHPHLVEDLLAKRLPADAIAICQSIEQFVDQHLKPLLPTKDDVLAAIQAGAYELFDFDIFFEARRGEIGRRIEDQLGYGSIPGWPSELLEDPHVAYVEDPGEQEIVEAYAIDEDKLFLAYDIVADINLDLFVLKSDFYWISEEVDLAVEQPDWNDHVMLTSKSVRLPIRISLELRLAAPDVVESFEVELSEFSGWCGKCGSIIHSDAAETCTVCGLNLIKPGRARRKKK
jgi:rRNA maturation endonuclease Nob1